MRVTRIVGIIGVGLLLASAVPVVAHHAFSAEFDANRPLQLEGTVTRMEWINPHAWIHIDVTKEDGTVESVDDRGGYPEHALPARLHERLAAARDQDHGRRVSGEGRVDAC